MDSKESAPLHRFRAVAPDGEQCYRASDEAIRRRAGFMFEKHVRPIQLESWTVHGWERYDEINTAEWWKTVGRRKDEKK